MKKSEKDLKAAFEAIDIVAKHLENNPDDQSFEEMTESEMLQLRTRCAEAGVELIPQEIKETVEIIKHIRRMLRENEK